MADIYNRQVSNLAGVFTADRAKLTFADFLAALVQSMQFTYAQTVTRLFEVGKPNIYYVGGRTQGQASINRVIGPQSTVCAFYQKYGDVCNSSKRNIDLTLEETNCVNGANANGSTTFHLLNTVITQVAIGVTAQEMIISDNTAIMYSSLECDGQ